MTGLPDVNFSGDDMTIGEQIAEWIHAGPDNCRTTQAIAAKIDVAIADAITQAFIDYPVQASEISDNDGFDAEQELKLLKPEAWEILKHPIVQSLLYDINLLPEQIAKSKHWFYMLSVIAHMDQVINRVLLNPEMPAQELRLHMGELTADEMRVARAAITWANTHIEDE